MNTDIMLKPLNKDYMVQKSRPLLLASDMNYTVNQLKLIDTYLSCINSHDPNNDTIVFSLHDYENLLGLKRIKTNEIVSCLRALSSLVITLCGDNECDLVMIPLFSKLSTKLDNISGERVICLKCNSEAKPYFFSVEEKGYVSYKLGNITSMKSKHSIYLYQYLKSNVFRSKWCVPLDVLKESALHLKATMYQNNFKDFRKNILDKAINEVNCNTDIDVEYCTVTSGNKVTGIEFIVFDAE